jgi:hypothetical protein
MLQKTIRRSRIYLLAPVAALAFYASAFAATAPPAHAMRTLEDVCGGYIYGWNYWNDQFYKEFVRSEEQVTPYLEYAGSRVNEYYDLVIQNNC